MLPFVRTAQKFARKTAIVSDGHRFSYEQLLTAARAFASDLLGGQEDLAEARIAYLIAPGFDYVRVQWGIWLAGGIAVPLCTDHPQPALRYTLSDAQVSIVIASSEFAERTEGLAKEMNLDFRLLTNPDTQSSLPAIGPERRAMILYTSGTTNQPKGVVSSHNNLQSQIAVLQKAWEWSENDHILNVLPLHHVHGIINVVNCALWSGACCTFLPHFSAKAVFEIFQREDVNVFMAVPTIYYKLIAWYDTLAETEQQTISSCLKAFRLMVSGSAALPVSVMERWETISGHRLLERYGMTEIGMALSNPYHGPRYPGHVGWPLPGVGIRLRTDEGREPATDEPAEIQVKGPAVFSEYWQRPEATAESFTADGWFLTGDVALLDAEQGYRILGRSSVDIIKSGGYKISALEIEEVLRRHPQVADCAVVGIPDEEWGEIVGAALTGADVLPDTEAIRQWLKEYLPAYKTPRRFQVLSALPRNAMGKVTKKEVVKLFTTQHWP